MNHTFHIIIKPRTTQSVPWDVDLRSVTLANLQTLISNVYPKFQNTALLFQFITKDTTQQPESDEALRALLRRLVMKKEMRVVVYVSTPAKPFSDWTLSEVSKLFGFEEGDFPLLECGSAEPNWNSEARLLNELRLRMKHNPITTCSLEATRSLYTFSYLVAAVGRFEEEFHVIPQQRIHGPHGMEPVDYAIKLLKTGEIVGVTEVTKDDISQGIAQCAVQLESAVFSRKRKAEGIKEQQKETLARAFGIVTDAQSFIFVKCSMNERNISLEVSPSMVIDYRCKNWQDQAIDILRVIVWLLMEARVPLGEECEVGTQGDKRDKHVRRND